MAKSTRSYDWKKPKAKQKALTREATARKERRKRLLKLVDLIVRTVKQPGVNGHLNAPSLDLLLFVLKDEVDLMPRGSAIRQPYSQDIWSLRNYIQGDREQFFRDAFNIAYRRDEIQLYADGSAIWLYAKHTAPKWNLYRDGQVVADYIPSDQELEISLDSISEEELPLPDRLRAKVRSWLQAA